MTRTLLLPALLAFVGCDANLGDEDCTELGCGLDYEGSVFSFDRDREWWSEQGAAYVFTLAFEGATHSCAATLGGDQSCDSELLSLVGYSSGTGDDAWWGFSELVLHAFPAEATLTVDRDGVIVLEQTHSIEVESYYPNGMECGPACTAWSSGDLDW